MTPVTSGFGVSGVASCAPLGAVSAFAAGALFFSATGFFFLGTRVLTTQGVLMIRAVCVASSTATTTGIIAAFEGAY